MKTTLSNLSKSAQVAVVADPIGEKELVFTGQTSKVVETGAVNYNLQIQVDGKYAGQVSRNGDQKSMNLQHEGLDFPAEIAAAFKLADADIEAQLV